MVDVQITRAARTNAVSSKLALDANTRTDPMHKHALRKHASMHTHKHGTHSPPSLLPAAFAVTDASDVRLDLEEDMFLGANGARTLETL